MNCDEVEWSEPSPGGERREPTTCAREGKEMVREAGPFPPGGGAVEGERRESLMMQ